ncbi:hypothetical protein pb186bvf_005973 [Paramecium bursaria]
MMESILPRLEIGTTIYGQKMIKVILKRSHYKNYNQFL